MWLFSVMDCGVAPYNAQVSLLLRELPKGSRVGTVDKFQGQEAPVVIYSMATSKPRDAPRGMEFLYSGNRLNVATSRAQCDCARCESRAVRCAVQDAKTDGIGQCLLQISGDGGDDISLECRYLLESLKPGATLPLF
jgi:hypothetical protein